ncbi:MAG: Type 1 glutamine amidotransferase-like domain-containing protein [Pyrinomonadaceae bacterium]
MTDSLRPNAVGRVFAIGGGEDRDDDCLILKKFVELAGGNKAHVVVLTTASDVPEQYVEVYDKAFKRLKVATLNFIDVGRREDAMQDDVVETVKKAPGIFFTGGNQFLITSLIGGTKLSARSLMLMRTA